MNDIERFRRRRARRLSMRTDGGPGSGNWGHEGRDGKIGGSGKGGGLHNRGHKGEDGTFSSESKTRKSMAKSHEFTPNDQKLIGELSHSGNPFKVYSKTLENDAGKGYCLYVKGNNCAVVRSNDPDPKFTKDNTIPLQDAMFEYMKSGEKGRIIAPVSKKSMQLETSRQEGPFNDKAYSKKRKDNAEDFLFGGVDYSNYEDKNFPEKQLTAEEKSALGYWTSGAYSSINKVARGDGDKEDNEKYGQAAQEIENALGKNKLDRDIYLYRNMNNLKKLFDVENESLVRRVRDGLITEDDLPELERELIGAVGRDEGFMACHTTGGFVEHRIGVRLYTPKGTEGMYIEGLTEYEGEVETLLQRGTTYRCTGVSLEYGRVIINAEVVGQYPRGNQKDNFTGKRRGVK